MIAWICRDKDGSLLMYADKPTKEDDEWFEPFGQYWVLLESELPEGVNPQWEDDEPIPVEIIINESIKLD